MKQLLNIILLCGLSLTISAQDWSYVKTRTMTNAGGTTYLDHFDYDNGLGQTHQQIDVNFTPNHNNLVTLIEYDDYRRPAQVWLPVEMSGSGVMNDNTVKSTATTFYSNSMPYTKNIYEQSPLERIKQRYLPGQEWYNAGKSQQTDWYTNTSSNPEGNALVLTMNQSTLSFSSTSQKYWIEKTTDEDDRKTITFTDLCGQVAAVRNYDSTPLTTYYAYDDFGDLRYVLPPEVADYYEGNPSQSLSPTSTLMEQYGYEYRYDNRHNCIYKRLPGCDPIYYIYDKAGHCIFSQDGVQRIAGKWSFNIPDAFGRTVMTGVFTGSIDYTTEPLRNTVFMATRSNGNMNLHGYIFSGTTPINNFSYGYLEIYTVQYYDDYSFIGNTGTFSTLNYSTPPSSDYGSRGLTAPKNMPTGSMTGRLTSTGVNGYDYATIFYDDRGRVIQTKTTNYMGGYGGMLGLIGCQVWYSYYDTTADNADECRLANPDVILSPDMIPLSEVDFAMYNGPTKTIIKQLFIAKAKETLGNVRGTFSGKVMIPQAELTMDYNMFITQGQNEWKEVMDNLIKRLERMMPWVHLENQRKMMEHTLELQKGTPLGIYMI